MRFLAAAQTAVLVTLVRTLMKALLASLRLDVRGREQVEEFHRQGRPVIYAFYHGEQFVLIPVHNGENVGIMVSLSRDGERQAALLRSFGFTPLRGSSTRGAVGGLVGLINHVRNGGDAAVAVDGPKGPLHAPKPGVITLASKSGGTIIPLRVLPTRCWRLRRTWDGYFIPKPLSHVTLEYRPPLAITGDHEADLAHLAAALAAPTAASGT